MGGALLRWIGPPLVRALSSSWRTEVFGLENLAAPSGDATPAHAAGDATGSPHGRGSAGSPGGQRACMTAVWHGRMLASMHVGRARNFAVLVSPSADGDISERMLRAFGYRVVRGSSSRGGARALRELLSELRAGSVVVLTPDGPRGPRHGMNPGLAWMSRATGFPVVPVGVGCNRAWRLSSWDAFTIPKPFSRVAIMFGEPVWVSRESGQPEMDAATELIRERILDCERRCFAHVGASVDW